MLENILTIKNLNVYYNDSKEDVIKKILNNVELSVFENDVIGIVGESGSGKSVLINAIGKNIRSPLSLDAERLTLYKNKGQEIIEYLNFNENQLFTIWGNEIAFIPPNARDKLNPIITVGEQFVNIIKKHQDIKENEAKKIVVDIFKKVQMPDPEENYNSYPHELSGGMAQRVVISIAFYLSPKLLLADEPTMGLDVTIQKQVLDLMTNLLSEKKSSIVLATRDLGIVANYCNKVIVMCSGKIVEQAKVKEIFKNAKHPYTRYLLEAAFASHGMDSKVDSTKVSSKTDFIIKDNKICPFIHRCNFVKEECRTKEPPFLKIEEDHYVKCHKWEAKD